MSSATYHVLQSTAVYYGTHGLGREVHVDAHTHTNTHCIPSSEHAKSPHTYSGGRGRYNCS